MEDKMEPGPSTAAAAANLLSVIKSESLAATVTATSLAPSHVSAFHHPSSFNFMIKQDNLKQGSSL